MVEQVWVLPPTRSHYRLYCWLARSVDGGERWPGREVRAVADQGVGASAGYLAGCPQCRHQLGVKPPLWVLLPGQEGELQSFPAYTPPQLGSKKLFNYPDQGWGGNCTNGQGNLFCSFRHNPATGKGFTCGMILTVTGLVSVAREWPSAAHSSSLLSRPGQAAHTNNTLLTCRHWAGQATWLV